MKKKIQLKTDEVAKWFFRLNGCLSIVNFIVHPDLLPYDQNRSQRTDADILAVRFPYRNELITSGDPMQEHEVFESQGKIDLIICEVKTSRCRLNGPWTNPEKENIHRVLYAIGAFPIERVPEVAKQLYDQQYYCDYQYRLRLFAIGRRRSNLSSKVVQLTWEEVLSFIFERFTKYAAHKSQHQQWDYTGRELYKHAIKCKNNNDDYVNSIIF